MKKLYLNFKEIFEQYYRKILMKHEKLRKNSWKPVDFLRTL